MPELQKLIKQMQEAFSKVDMKEFNKKVQQALKLAKKQLQDLKKSSDNNQIKIKVTNADAIKQIKQVRKEIEALNKETRERKLKGK